MMSVLVLDIGERNIQWVLLLSLLDWIVFFIVLKAYHYRRYSLKKKQYE